MNGRVLEETSVGGWCRQGGGGKTDREKGFKKN